MPQISILIWSVSENLDTQAQSLLNLVLKIKKTWNVIISSNYTPKWNHLKIIDNYVKYVYVYILRKTYYLNVYRRPKKWTFRLNALNI